ncbi:hypothetical protein NliqN6_5730 [Naganishia liquefaciens]|uniref:AMP-dependent synthetase/ligase domain-containing protein n=1 Tax=Naganishia liquefaciens TaxID=104408 RepID=A0A8H3TYT4_9TREE|nr:hypothetical protein NliqN6_5730 [Naganishia liquefaciens]
MAPRKHNEKASWEVDADKPKPQGETRARRSYCVKELVTSPAPGIETIHDIALYAARTHGKKNGFATRPVKRMVYEEKEVTKTNARGEKVKEKKKWTYYVLGGYEWLSYEQFLDKVRRVGSGLRELGVGGDEETMFNIYASTAVNWQIMAHACAFSAVTICTAYDSLGPSGLAHSLQEPGVRSMFTNAELLPTLIKVIDECPTVRLVVYDGTPDEALLEQLRGKRDGLKVVHIDEVERLGQDKPCEAVRANPDDVYCVMYTSGSTGTPKGVMLTHKNIIAAVGAIWHLLYEYLTPVDTYLAFLPLAHILEFVIETSWLFAGLSIGYGKIKTLTDASVKDSQGDILEFKPSILVGVPAVWETIRKGILAKVDKAGSVKKAIFNKALKLKGSGLPGMGAITDAVVFNAVKAQTGGRLKICFSGGGSLSPSTQSFVTNSLNILIQGYGLTETVAMAAILHPQFYAVGVAGGPVPSTEVKLVDVPEAGYLSTNKLPQGEIWLRGPSIAKGYYKRPDLDKEAFMADGWFKSGDVGQWNPDGTLSIIDRVKNLVKLSHGEYIAIERLESLYKSCPLVANGCVIAKQDHNAPAMIVVVHPANIMSFAKSHGVDADADDLEHLCRNKKLNAEVLRELNEHGRKHGLHKIELLEGVILTADEWTPESGLLTAAQKLQRKQIEKRYEDQIKEHYP